MERIDHRILFFDDQARRIPGARCRVLESGRLLLGTKVPAVPSGDAPGETRAKLAGDEKDEPPGGAARAGGGGQAPPAPQGCAAVTVRPAVRLEIVRAFSLRKGELHPPKKTSPEALSDPDEILARRAYRHERWAIKPPRTPTLNDEAKIGHIDADTIRASIEAWWGRNAAK